MSCMPSPFSLISFLHYFGVQDTEKIVLGNFRNFLRFDDGPELRGLHREDPKVRWAGPAGAEVAPRAEAVKTN